MDVDFPFHFDGRGRTAETAGDVHIRDLVEQVLFTAPGERINRPTFGCGLAQMVFTPNSEELAAAEEISGRGLRVKKRDEDDAPKKIASDPDWERSGSPTRARAHPTASAAS